ncbi:MAG: glycosyltransferase family 1 protein [Bacteroidales bacterium]|nr:glycosyltransferase family 1 protein [Bacteroidales bacterium]
MPLAGSSDGKNCLSSYSEYLETKDIEILFTGSYFGTPTKIWDNNANLPEKFLDQISDLLIHDDYTTIAEALKKVLGKHNIKLSHNFKQKNTSLMSLVMSYIRQFKRNELITKLCQHGLPITIYGKSWETMAKEFSNISFKGNVCTEETIALNKRAKIIINTNANFTHGAHDRVFTGICNGAVVFTDKSTFYDKRFKDEKDILYYSFNSLDKDIDKLKLYINDNEKLYSMATKCYDKIQSHELWGHRATLIEEIFNYSKILSRIE